MAISPPSDLILDVARAADPQKAMATTRALTDASAGAGAPEFTATLSTLSPNAADLRHAVYQNPVKTILPSSQTPERKAEIGLESVLLKSFIDQMLPKDATDVFGSGVAGDVWRSMLSEKIADQIAKSGTLKIGTRLFATHPDLLHSNKPVASLDQATRI